MTITTPGSIQVTDDSVLIVPSMAAEPLQTALENLNYLWKWHRPPLVDVCPTLDSTAGAGRWTVIVPIIPSADGIRYAFQARLMPSATSTLTITVDYATTASMSSWTNIYSSTPGTTAATLLTHTDSDMVIPATAVALRLDYQVAAGTLYLHHVLVVPGPADAAAGITASGFVPFDDGLLSLTGAPIHTELLDRVKLSTLAVLRDRRQNAFSFCQKSSGTPVVVATNTTFGGLPVVRAWFPYQGPTVQVEWRVLADVSAGGTTGLIQVKQVGHPKGEIRTFGASGSIESGSQVVAGGGTSTDPMTLHLQGTGAMRYADLELSAKATSGNSTYLRAAMAWWRPTE